MGNDYNVCGCVCLQQAPPHILLIHIYVVFQTVMNIGDQNKRHLPAT